VLAVVLSAFAFISVNALSPCLSNSLAPVAANLLAQSLSAQFQFPSTTADFPGIVQLVLNAEASEQQPALFFATPATAKLFVRVRNCQAQEFGSASDLACQGQSGQIVEIYCPAVFSDESNHVFIWGNSTLTPAGAFPLLTPLIYGSPGQFWFAFGSSGSSGFIENSGIPELSVASADVYVQPVITVSGQPDVPNTLVAVTGAVRASNEPCSPSLDCVLGSWSGFGACSQSCGGGVQSRSRTPIVLSQNGGTPCGPLGDVQQCNTQACNQELSDKGKAGVVIACIAAAILAFLIFFALSKNKRIFNGNQSKHHHHHKKTQSTQPSQPRRTPTKRTGEEEAAPVKTVHIWV